jgi:chromosome segregation ATPase
MASGCSTLGIATEDDLVATQSRLDSLGRVTGSIDRSVTQLQENERAMRAQMDSLSARYQAARQWLESLDLEAISQNVDQIHETAMNAESRSKMLNESYLSWLRTQHQYLGEEIKALEAQSGAATGAGDAVDTGSSSTEPDEFNGGGG